VADFITNTSPLYYLHRVGHLHLLPALLGRVIIPAEVVQEIDIGVSRGHDLPDPHLLEWAEIRPPTSIATQLRGFKQLGRGEIAVLSIALESHDAVAILDDLDARKAGTSLGVQVVGTMNIVVMAKKRGHVPSVRPILEALSEAGFRMSNLLRTAILSDAGES
jgi:uncharacterized protein